MSVEPMARLAYKEKVPVSVMREVCQVCMTEHLTGWKYDGEKSADVVKNLSDTIRNRLKALNYERYKFIVQVILGERREQGVRSGTRCFWDSNTDNQASESFTNDNIFAVAQGACLLHSHICNNFL